MVSIFARKAPMDQDDEEDEEEEEDGDDNEEVDLEDEEGDVLNVSDEHMVMVMNEDSMDVLQMQQHARHSVYHGFA